MRRKATSARLQDRNDTASTLPRGRRISNVFVLAFRHWGVQSPVYPRYNNHKRPIDAREQCGPLARARHASGLSHTIHVDSQKGSRSRSDGQPPHPTRLSSPNPPTDTLRRIPPWGWAASRQSFLAPFPPAKARGHGDHPLHHEPARKMYG